MRNSAVNTPPVAASPPPMFHPGAAGMGQQVFYGQPPHGLIPSQVSDLYLNAMPCFCLIMCIPILLAVVKYHIPSDCSSVSHPMFYKHIMTVVLADKWLWLSTSNGSWYEAWCPTNAKLFYALCTKARSAGSADGK